MKIKITGHVEATGDCGHKIQVPVDRLDEDFDCPVCGATDRFSPEQAAKIKAELMRKAGDFGVEQVRGELDDMLSRTFRNSKHVKYTPGRRRS